MDVASRHPNRAGTFWSNWKLLAPAVLAPLIETALLRAAPEPSTAAIGPQVTAPPPFDLFHDLRWVSVYHDSWLTLALELCAVIALRSFFASYMVRAAWPSEGAPSIFSGARRTSVFYLIAAVLLMPWVALMFGFSVIGVSYLFFASLPPVVVVAMLIHRGASSQAAGRWWEWRPRWSSFALIALAFVWLSAGGALAAGAILPVALLAAAGCGVLNAYTYHAMVHGIAVPISTRKRQIVVPVAIVLMFTVVVVGAAEGFARKRTPAFHLSPRSIARIPARARGHPVLVAGGVRLPHRSHAAVPSIAPVRAVAVFVQRHEAPPAASVFVGRHRATTRSIRRSYGATGRRATGCVQPARHDRGRERRRDRRALLPTEAL